MFFLTDTLQQVGFGSRVFRQRKGQARFVVTSQHFSNENEPATRDERARERSSAHFGKQRFEQFGSQRQRFVQSGSMNEEVDSRDTNQYEQFPLDGQTEAAASSKLIMNAMRCQDDNSNYFNTNYNNYSNTI